MKQTFITLLLCLAVHLCHAQVPSDGDYQSRNFGNWSQVSRWQVYVNGAWRSLDDPAAGAYRNKIPSSASGKIMIRNHIRITHGVMNANEIIIASGGQLSILDESVLTLVEDLTNAPLIIQEGGTLTNNGGTIDLRSLSTITCQIYGTVESSRAILTSTASVLKFNAGAIYKHLNRSGGSIPLATWDVNATCLIGGLAGTNPSAPTNLNQVFGNVVWSTPLMGPTMNFSLGGNLHTVQGNLIFESTGSIPREIRLKSGGAGYMLFIGGDFIINDGLITLSQNQTTDCSITLQGNLEMTGGTLKLGHLNNSAIKFFLKGTLHKTGGILTRGTGTGAFTILPVPLENQ